MLVKNLKTNKQQMWWKCIGSFPKRKGDVWIYNSLSLSGFQTKYLNWWCGFRLIVSNICWWGRRGMRFCLFVYWGGCLVLCCCLKHLSIWPKKNPFIHRCFIILIHGSKTSQCLYSRDNNFTGDFLYCIQHLWF